MKGSRPASKLAKVAFLLATLLWLQAVGGAQQTRAQSLDLDRGRARQMLKEIHDDIRKQYYDANFRSVDIDKRFTAADEQLKTATSLGHTYAILADPLSELDDSHTFFVPPPRNYRVEYGWQMQMIGDACYVVAVAPGSDAASQGVKVGDRVRSVDGFPPTRENMWKLKYIYYTLSPRRGMKVEVEGSEGSLRRVEVKAKVEQEKRVLELTPWSEDIWGILREAEREDRLQRGRYHEFSDSLIVWKMPIFDLDDKDVDRMMSRVKKHRALILDLRGNPGGAEKTLQRLIGHFFNSDLTVAELKGRQPGKSLVAKRVGEAAFEGKLAVLVDSESASAAELFARLVQLQRRGTVLGDRTAGAVMESRFYPHKMGADTMILYGVSVTVADVVMSDGKSLEKSGVLPDEFLLPSGADLAANRDPVLSRAAALLGFEISAENAGALFPLEWRR